VKESEGRARLLDVRDSAMRGESTTLSIKLASDATELSTTFNQVPKCLKSDVTVLSDRLAI
jgi:hypothetical protein